MNIWSESYDVRNSGRSLDTHTYTHTQTYIWSFPHDKTNCVVMFLMSTCAHTRTWSCLSFYIDAYLQQNPITDTCFGETTYIKANIHTYTHPKSAGIHAHGGASASLHNTEETTHVHRIYIYIYIYISVSYHVCTHILFSLIPTRIVQHRAEKTHAHT
jgi:hypothetical protein